ncbi:exodeoxyribonuclease V subunit beta [Solilutibacter silvestris]|uniref:RecBCD enzyme subunit RecB n=1 Tax=Solilutibacter silvestris TaxID=1645665 RepID=A0A2K1Q174_9GAMM|nr:exodeoxyribonuclease V subunit beta [Lysobacter silvestris]PNS08793.1 recB: exodeoxyribonuclease V, beta subunit [Lysobacter silvestris]
MNIEARDPYLDLPLTGVRLIEASAGTGKTFTLATLATRLVVERGLRIGEVLAVTFTEAATQELRKRIRERLQLALEVLDAAATGDETQETTLTRHILDVHLARGDESRDALRRRLRQAVLESDLAAIFTIHGFCMRVLREHAVETGRAFAAPELLANDRDLRSEVAADLWRAHAIDAASVDDLFALWGQGHEALAKDLSALMREPVLLPPDLPLPADPAPALRETSEALAQAFRAHGEDFRMALLSALDGKVLNAQSYKPDWIHALFDAAKQWSESGDGDTPFEHDKLANLQHEALLAKTNKAQTGKTPESPLFAAIAPYLEALRMQREYVARRRVALLHRLRADTHARMATLKQQRRVQTYDDLIDGVADALAGSDGDVLAARLRAQYQVALVDEFQDTDARQWAIFNHVFGAGSGAPALFLIGDPKQAIYGFRGGDVHAYLVARDTAAEAPLLSHNFRSRPALLAAIATLYGNVSNFVCEKPEIRFHPVEPGGSRSNEDFLRDGESAPALTVWQAPQTGEFDAKGKPKPWSADASRERATDACVAAIHAVLTDARIGKATLKDKNGMRAVQPGDIAVLVRSHREATMIQQALAMVGIPAVAAGKQSLFATAEARELHALLLALLHTGDDGRLRAALATVLVGADAAAIEKLDHDVVASHAWQQEAQAWRERWNRAGILALVCDLCARHGEHLLGLFDGERRLSNYLQLAELLQEAQRQALGLHGLVDWLERRIASADSEDETQLLRLESDARRVQIVTLHKSKGLEYPLVFLPFAGIGRRGSSPGRHCVAHDEEGCRRLHWKFDLPEAQWQVASDEWKEEQSAEDARLLYVGLTRAEHALWIASGMFYNHDKTALAKMLRDPAAFAASAGIVFDARSPSPDLPRLSPATDTTVPPARVATRPLSNDWWVYSFSQLAKADGGDASSASTLPAGGGNDEPDAVEDTVDDGQFDPRFAGNRYGVALHAALEHTDFARWQGWSAGDGAPDGEADIIAKALREEGYGADVLEDGVVLTAQLIGNTLTVGLPEGVRLCDVPAGARRAEIEFQFALQPVQIDALLELLHGHGVVRDRHGFGLRQRLEGLMTGLIDLTYHVDGKWYVLDYKSNRLPTYDAPALQRAMAHSEYDLQALIYTLALHRWLRFRLGDEYDYARDFGGIRYLFCRGLDATRSDSPGIHAQRFSPELVHALDALFGHVVTGVAA